jgi:ankyrin repeat protein
MSAIKKEKKALVEKMFEAFDNQDLDTLKSLLTNGYYCDELDLPNIPSSDGRILLHEAALSGQVAVVKLLIRQGADIYARNKDYLSAAEVVRAKRGHDDPIFKLLRNKELTLLQECVLADNTDQLKFLIKRGADLDITDSQGNSIAHFAAEYGKVASLKEIESSFGTDVFRNKKNSAGKTPLDVLRIVGRFFTYEEGAYAIAKDKKGSSKRPGNQNALPVLIKMTKRGEKVISDDSDLELVSVEKKLFNKVNSGKNKIKLRSLKIDIAHNIAISKIMDATLERMKSPFSASDSAAEDFADNLLSTDDDEGRKETKKLFTDIRDQTILPFHIIAQADHVINHFNRASRNLRPGHSSTNRSVGDMRDPPLFHIKDRHPNEVREAPHSRRLARSAKKFIQKTGQDYQPHTRITNEVKEAKSSSFHANPGRAWFPYTSPKDIISPFSESSSESYKGENEDDEESPKQLSSSRYKGSTFSSKKPPSPIITSVAELTEEDDEGEELSPSNP